STSTPTPTTQFKSNPFPSVKSKLQPIVIPLNKQTIPTVKSSPSISTTIPTPTSTPTPTPTPKLTNTFKLPNTYTYPKESQYITTQRRDPDSGPYGTQWIHATPQI